MDSEINHPPEEVYNINGYKHLTELAKEYFTDVVTAGAARRILREKIDEYEELSKQMAEAGYTRKTLDLSPRMQLIIYRLLGPPHMAVFATPDHGSGIEEETEE